MESAASSATIVTSSCSCRMDAGIPESPVRECFCHCLSLILPADYQKDLFCTHDGADSHGVSLARNIICGGEEPFVGFDRAFCKIHTVRLFCKVFCWLIEPDMSIVFQSKKLQIHSAPWNGSALHSVRTLFTVFFCAIRKIVASGLIFTLSNRFSCMK